MCIVYQFISKRVYSLGCESSLHNSRLFLLVLLINFALFSVWFLFSIFRHLSRLNLVASATDFELCEWVRIKNDEFIHHLTKLLDGWFWMEGFGARETCECFCSSGFHSILRVLLHVNDLLDVICNIVIYADGTKLYFSVIGLLFCGIT